MFAYGSAFGVPFAVTVNITPKATRDSAFPLNLILIHVSNEIEVPAITSQTATINRIILPNLRRRPPASALWHEPVQAANFPPQTVVNLLSVAFERLPANSVSPTRLPTP